MNPIAANHTVRGVLPPGCGPRLRACEDLNWPTIQPPADRKPPRPATIRAPGRDVDWLGTTPTLQ